MKRVDDLDCDSDIYHDLIKNVSVAHYEPVGQFSNLHS